MSYRSLYKGNSLAQTKNNLKLELQKLQQDLRDMQQREVAPRRQNTYFDYDQLLNNKLLLIGGCILIGIGIAYFLLNPNRKRC